MTARLLIVLALMLPMAAQAPAGTTPATPAATATAPAAASGGTGSSTVKEDKQTDIVADQMEIQDKEHRAIFTGNVDMTRPDVHWTADKMIVDYDEVKQDDGTTKTDVKTVDSTGHVTIVTKSQTITGDWAKMDVKANKLQVGGKVKVVQGKSILLGELLNADLDTNKSEMSGGRVKGSFLPK